jgi:hypothetical protein
MAEVGGMVMTVQLMMLVTHLKTKRTYDEIICIPDGETWIKNGQHYVDVWKHYYFMRTL